MLCVCVCDPPGTSELVGVLSINLGLPGRRSLSADCLYSRIQVYSRPFDYLLVGKICVPADAAEKMSGQNLGPRGSESVLVEQVLAGTRKLLHP